MSPRHQSACGGVDDLAPHGVQGACGPAGPHLSVVCDLRPARWCAGRGLDGHARGHATTAGGCGTGHGFVHPVRRHMHLFQWVSDRPLGHRPLGGGQLFVDRFGVGRVRTGAIVFVAVVANLALGLGCGRCGFGFEPFCIGPLFVATYELAARLLGHWRHNWPVDPGCSAGNPCWLARWVHGHCGVATQHGAGVVADAVTLAS